MQVGASLMNHESEIHVQLIEAMQRVTKLEALAERAAEDRRETANLIIRVTDRLNALVDEIKDTNSQLKGGRKLLSALWLTGVGVTAVVGWWNGWLKWLVAGAK